jgi:SpoIVB peptidase S55
MFRIERSFLLAGFCVWTVLVGSLAAAPAGLKDIWDPTRYIGLDEIRPGMKAYCLTEYGVAGIEKFSMEVVDVVRNVEPGRDAILVQGTDKRFLHTGPVAGCSGSPVYIDGRLAGALAFTWTYAKDPLYGATPIAEMLAVGRGGASEKHTEPAGLALDYTAPIDFADVDRQLRDDLVRASHGLRGACELPSPLIASGLSAGVREQLSAMVEPLGLMVVAGGGAGGGNDTAGAEKVRLTPGACLAVPMVSGDISMSVYGTVTDVVGDKLYAFGHDLLGYGAVNLPMATAKVHTVVSNVASSFKLASVLKTVGALTTDEAAGVVGWIGAQAKTIPLTIRVNRYNDTVSRLYKCRLVNNRLLTPFYLRMTMAGAAFQLGDLPPEHTIEYKVAIDVRNAEPVTFENVSSGVGLNELIIEVYSALGLLMNNPYEKVNVDSITCEMHILPKSIVSHIWAVDLSDSKVKAGQSIEVGVIVESALAGKKKYQCRLDIPRDLAPGKYELTVCGPRDYEQFLVKSAPQRFIAQNLPGLIDALNNSLRIERNKLYFLLDLPAGGVIVDDAELPDLPATKALVLQDPKRALRIMPYAHWLERSLDIGAEVMDKSVLRITIEK